MLETFSSLSLFGRAYEVGGLCQLVWTHDFISSAMWFLGSAGMHFLTEAEPNRNMFFDFALAAVLFGMNALTERCRHQARM